MPEFRDLTAASTPAQSDWLVALQDPNSAYDYAKSAITNIPIVRSQITQEALERYPIALMSGVRNADGTVLDATGASTKFKIVPGGYGSGTLTLQGRNANNSTQTDTLMFEFPIPPEYDDDDDVRLVVHCRVNDSAGTVGTKTIDAEVYELTDAGAVGSDLCATTIQTMSNSFADYSFTITDSGLAGGDRLICFVRIIIQETASGGNIFSLIGSIEMQLDILG